jgi:hypothetical protein
VPIGCVGFLLLWLLRTTTLLHPFVIVLPENLYKIPFWILINNNITPQTILHVSFSNIVHTPTSILLIDMRILGNLGIHKTQGRVFTLPSLSNNGTLLCLFIFHVDSSSWKTWTPLYLLSSKIHSLWRFMWKGAPEWWTMHHNINVHLYIPSKYPTLLHKDHN